MEAARPATTKTVCKMRKKLRHPKHPLPHVTESQDRSFSPRTAAFRLHPTKSHNSSSFASSSSSSYDWHSLADAQVGNGLSLLQHLTNGMDFLDEAAAYKAALGWVGHRTQDGMVEGLMYAHSEIPPRELHSRLECPPPFHSPHRPNPRLMPSSLRPPPPYRLCSAVLTNVNVNRR